MNSSNLPTANDISEAILLNAYLYEKERKKKITRYRMSYANFRTISKRVNLRQEFIDQIQYELLESGWALIIDTNGDYCFYEVKMLNNWTKLDGKRVSEFVGAPIEILINTFPDFYQVKK